MVQLFLHFLICYSIISSQKTTERLFPFMMSVRLCLTESFFSNCNISNINHLEVFNGFEKWLI